MKIIVFLAAISFFISNISFSQNYNWITPNTAYLKLYVNDDGMYRISRTDFSNAGINTSTIDPRTVKVYNRGSEIPVFFQGESDGVFDASDYLDFYGIRSYGGLTKYYTIDNALYYTKDEYYNMYSDTNAYWIGWGGSNGLRYADYGFTSATLYSPNFVYEKIHSEKDKVYSPGERADGNDFRNFNNELFQGEGWYWANMSNGQIITDTFTVPLADTLNQTCTFRFFAYPFTINTSAFNEHNIRLYVNNTTVANLFKNDFNRFDTTVTFSSAILKKTGTNNIYYEFVTTSSVTTLLDFGEIQYPKIFAFRNNYFRGTLSSDSVTKLFRITGYVPANPLFIYDVKNGFRVTNYSYSGDTLIFSAKGNSQFEIYNKNLTKKPFRISQRQVPNYASTTNGADYLLIYNSMFEAQAVQLKNHRETNDNYRFTKAEIKDIYDIFNYGLEEPVAIRNFTKYVYNNWQLPKLKYICLLGRGSLDPKKNLTTSVYYKNIIPVAGNPSSDNYYANFNFGAFTYYPMVAIGRLPAYTAQEAQDMVNNIIFYETVSPALWWKNYTFICGGGTADDQNSFQAIVNPIINSQIVPPTLSGNVSRIYRVDNTTTVTYNYKDSIRRNINSGAMIVSFTGHAGFENWEDGMQDPATLENYGKLPFILSMTCYTGKTGTPDTRSFGEQFVKMANRGAIGFVGTTGWGWFYSQSVMENWLLSGIAKDTVRQMGEVLKYGLNKIIQDSLTSSVRHTINCYNLLGDPALKLSIPLQPDFSIYNTEYKLSNNFPALNEKVTLSAFPKNFGLYADSCKIRFHLKKNNITIQTRDTVIRAFKWADTVRYTFTLDSIANHSVQIILDNDNWYPNEDKNTNTVTINIPMMNTSFVTVKPLNNSVVRTDSVEFAGLNPVSNNLNNNVKVILEFDTTKSFNSPAKKTFVKSNVTGVLTKFKTSIPVLNPNVLYFWRTNAMINSDSTGWTSYQTFTYNPSALSLANSSKETTGELNLGDSSNTVLKVKSDQFPISDLFSTSYQTSGLQLKSYPLTLITKSYGSNGAEISFFTINDKNVNIDGGRSPGLNMLKVKRLDGHILTIKNFTLTSSSSSDSVINFLNTFDSTYYLMALNASYVDYNQVNQLNSSAKAKIREFGSTKIDSVFKFGQFDTWSFIGYRGATQSNVSEQYYKYSVSLGWRPSTSTISSIYKDTYGTVSTLIGPAQDWKDFSWTQTLNPLSTILYDVYGVSKTGSQTLLLSNQNSNSFVDLSTFSSFQYPYMNLVSKISMDTSAGYISSVMNSLKVNYNLPSELILDIPSFIVSDTLVNIGNSVKINFRYHSAGYRDIPGIIVNLYKSSPLAQNLFKTDTVKSVLKIDSSRIYSAKFDVPYYRTGGDNKIPIYLEIKPTGETNEMFTFNNSLDFNLTNKNAVAASLIEIFSDGQLVKNGDYVRLNPEIKISISKQNPLQSLNTNSQDFKVKINDRDIELNQVANQVSQLKKENSKSAEEQITHNGPLVFHPQFIKGTNRLTVINTTENGVSDTLNLDLVVSENLSVTDFYNYPNPMREKTYFVFNLIGSVNPSSSRIKIYTASGRLIRELKFAAVVGYNQVEWDGKDNDGDVIANGTYLYKMIADDDVQTETAVQKLAVLK